MRTIRIGVVGVGGMGRFHALALAQVAGVEVVAVSDPFEQNARAVHDAVGAEIVSDPFAVIADATLDGVVVASPDETHADFALAAAAAGRYLLLEKPLATTVRDAKRVLDAEVSGGRRLFQLGFMREFDPAHRQVAAELDDIGPIDHIRALHRNANNERRPLDQIVVQSMIHDVHTVRYLTGASITSVVASGSGSAAGSYRHVLATCELDSGAHALLEFDDGGFAYEVSVEVLGRRGDALTGAPVRATRRRAGSIDVHLGRDWFGWFAEAYRLQDAAWVDSLRSGIVTGPSTWDGYEAQRVVDAIMTSLATGQAQAISHQEVPGLYA